MVRRTEDHVFSVEPASNDGGDKELGAICVRTSVCHGQKTGFGVLHLEVLV